MSSSSRSQPVSEAAREVEPSGAWRGSVHLYTAGLCYGSACAPAGMTGPEVLAEINRHSPSGTERGWQLSADKTFRGGQPNPCPCDQEAGRTHWLLEA